MKSYTNLRQSQKLKEILPIESADWHYVRMTHDFKGNPVDRKWSEPKYGNPQSSFAEYVVQNFSSYEKLPCWSLAALLDIYPMIVGRDMDRYCCWQNCKNLHSRHYDNPIDACYEMILKLKELKML